MRIFVCRLDKMIHLLLLLSFKLIALSLSASFLSTELSCPEGGYITREKYCEKTPGCENGEDSDTIYPRGPCIKVGDDPLGFHFSCDSNKGEVVPLKAMCNGSVECTNGKDETHAFCHRKVDREKRAVCSPGCQNGGTCTNPNTCECASGWSGNQCQTPVCSPGCENGGTCTGPNTCQCSSGWSGDQCQTPVCSPRCQNGGTCTDPNTCECASGWSGDQCQTPVCSPGCENSGTCTDPNTCECAYGWSGDQCQTPVCRPECRNGGTCKDPNTCECASGWVGERCHGFVCSPECQNGGTCTDPNTCQCDAGWSGDQCQTPVCSPGCENGGTCTDPNTCECASGWSGDHCQTPVCSPVCQNGGTCTDPNTCQCSSDWSGDHCQTPVCSPGCQNGGTCTDPNTCECVSGWSGDQCQTFVCSPACMYGEECIGPNTCEFSHGAGGDPHFLVNLPDNSNLCFSLQGEPGFAFNLVTSKFIVINAVFINAPPRLQDWTTVIGEIGVLYRTKSHSVLKIHFNFKDKSIYVSGYGVLDAKRVSRVVLKGEQLEVHSSNITHTWASTVFVSIGDELKFNVFFNHDNLDIVWSDVSSFNHSSHGILGQFFNKGTKVDKEKGQLVLPKCSPIPVILEDPKPEVHHKSQCWRPQTPGYQGEGLLEGDYLEYFVDSVFATDFKYSMTSF